MDDETVRRLEYEARRRDEAIVALEARVGDLAKTKARKGGWDIFAIFVPLLQALLLAGFAYWFTQRVSQALEEKKFEVSSASEMKDLLIKMQTGDDTEAGAAAVALASYGNHAVLPLVNAIELYFETGRLSRVDGARSGLRAVGWAYPKEVCASLEKVLTNRSHLFHWATHEAVIPLLGDLDCEGALPMLREYRAGLGTGPPREAISSLAERVGGAPDASAVQAMREALDETISVLAKGGGSVP